MGAYDLLAAVAAAGIAVAAVVAVLGRGSVRRSGQRGDLVRYSAVSGASALVCAVMNILEANGGGVVAAAVGNATNVFAPAMLWAMARQLNGRREIGVVSAGAASLLILAITFVVTLDQGVLIKTAAIVVACVLLGVEVRRATLRTTPGTLILAVSIFAFAAYNASRLLVAATAGMYSWAWQTLVSSGVTSVASAVVILLMSVSLVRMGRALTDAPEPGTLAYDRGVLRDETLGLMSQHPDLVALTITVPELDLIRAAHGPERADTVADTLLDAAREALPGGVVGAPARNTVVAFLPADTERAGLGRAVGDAFARRMPRIGYDDTPDVRVTQQRVGSASDLDGLLDLKRMRRRVGTRRRESDRA